MKKSVAVSSLLLMGLLLAGCSSGLLNRKSTVPQASNVPVNNNLALPPDLQLATPGTRAAPLAPAASAQTDGVYDTSASSDYVPGSIAAKQAQRTAAQGRQNCPSGIVTTDVYVCYGIQKTKADGKPKTEAELKAELKAAVIAEKRRTNPRYGTMANIGAIFQDN